MKKFLLAVLSLALLILPIGGCGGEECIVSSLPESAVDIGTVENTDGGTTTTTEKATETENLPSYSTTYRDPLTSQKPTTTTTRRKTTVKCTYPTIPFSYGARVREWERGEAFKQDFSGRIITSKAQLDALALDVKYETDNYDDRFFKDNALVVLEFKLTSGSIQLLVDTLGVNGDTMTVFYTTLRPTPFTCDMAYRRILLEVDRNKVEGVNTVVGYEEKTYSAYSNPTAF